MKDKLNVKRGRGFTLIELLVVIAIIAVLAGMLFTVAGPVTRKRNESLIKTQLSQLETAINRYKEQLGFYPPQGDSKVFNCAINPLFYELTGTKFDPAAKTYQTINGKETIRTDKMNTVFGVSGFANSEPGKVKNFYENIKPSAYAELANPGDTADIEVLIVPVAGVTPQPLPAILSRQNKPLNTWRYVSDNPTNNPGKFDLWAEIKGKGNTPRIIGNW